MRKDHHKSKTKMNIPVRAAAVLLCLTLASTYFVSGLFARYSTSDQSGGNARVARFSFDGGFLNATNATILSRYIEASLIPGEENEDVTLIIENNSEVAVEYTIDVTNETKNLPLQFSIEKKTGSSGTPTENDDAHIDSDAHADSDTLTNAATYTAMRAPGSGSPEYYTLHINWQPGENDLARMGMVDYLLVTVTATQID